MANDNSNVPYYTFSEHFQQATTHDTVDVYALCALILFQNDKHI